MFLIPSCRKEGYRKKGVGSSLVLAAEQQLKKDGMEDVAIFVDEDDPELHKYYEKRGYKKGGKYRCLHKKL